MRVHSSATVARQSAWSGVYRVAAACVAAGDGTAELAEEGITLVIGSFDGEVGLAIECADELRNVIVPELQDAYPGLEVAFDREEGSDDTRVMHSMELTLSPDVYPLRTYESFLDEPERALADPLAGLLSAVRCGRSGRIACAIRASIAPASPRRVRQHRRIDERLERGFRSDEWRRWYARWACDRRAYRRLVGWFVGRLLRSTDRAPSQSNVKGAEGLFACRLVVECRAPAEAAQIAKKRVREMAAAFGRFASADCRFLVVRGLPQSSLRTQRFLRCISSLRPRRFLLTAKEIATLWHPPVMSADNVSRTQRSTFRELEAPLRLSSSEERGVTVLGRVKFRSQRQQFGIAADDLRRHMLVVGKTGCGKSTFLQHVILQQMRQGRGIVVIDPHGQLVDDLLDHVPRRRTNDVILFDAADRRHPVAFNPLQGPPGSDPTLVADSVLTAFKKVFGFDEATAPRLLHIFRHCLLTLVGTPQTTLMSVQRLLVDANYRKTMVSQVDNAAVRQFWTGEFGRWHERQRTEYIASLQNKLGAFTSNARLQAILCSTQQGISLRSVLDHSNILLCNLSKGTMGHEASAAGLRRCSPACNWLPSAGLTCLKPSRPDTSVIVDEFHLFFRGEHIDGGCLGREFASTAPLTSWSRPDAGTAGQDTTKVLGNCGSTLCGVEGRSAMLRCWRTCWCEGLTPKRPDANPPVSRISQTAEQRSGSHVLDDDPAAATPHFNEGPISSASFPIAARSIADGNRAGTGPAIRGHQRFINEE
ncbi:MAG: DUF87 domain-containing protein [Planctomycetaceae bacterium]